MSKASANLVVAIKAANKVLSAAFASGDMKKTAACYTKNARLLAPNTPACNGQAAIARFWSGARDMGIGRVVLRTLEIESHGKPEIRINYTAPQIVDAAEQTVSGRR